MGDKLWEKRRHRARLLRELSYTQDDVLDEMYPGDGARNEGITSPAMDRPGVTFPGVNQRPATRGSARPMSRVPVSTQTERQVNYAIPDIDARPTSPVARLLNRSNTMPFMSVESIHNKPMDPFTRQYYHRQWRSGTPSSELILNRIGRAGGVWRHVRACTANTGSHLAFIDGVVKQEDNVYFPGFKSVGGTGSTSCHIPMTFPMRQSAPSATRKTRKSHESIYSDHAKNGFKYWYQESKPIDFPSLRRNKTDLEFVRTSAPVFHVV